jgi:hypothetical protein
MKIIGTLLIIIGFLTAGGGMIAAAVSQFIPNEECELADRYRREADDLSKKAAAETESAKRSDLQSQALGKMQSARTWDEGCRTRKTGTTIALFAGIATGIVGLIIAIAGFFIFRRAGRASI